MSPQSVRLRLWLDGKKIARAIARTIHGGGAMSTVEPPSPPDVPEPPDRDELDEPGDDGTDRPTELPSEPGDGPDEGDG